MRKVDNGKREKKKRKSFLVATNLPKKLPENPIWLVSHPHPPEKQPHYCLAIHIPFMFNSKLYLYFPGFVGVGLIIRIKANSVWL